MLQSIGFCWGLCGYVSGGVSELLSDVFATTGPRRSFWAPGVAVPVFSWVSGLVEVVGEAGLPVGACFL